MFMIFSINSFIQLKSLIYLTLNINWFLNGQLETGESLKVYFIITYASKKSDVYLSYLFCCFISSLIFHTIKVTDLLEARYKLVSERTA